MFLLVVRHVSALPLGISQPILLHVQYPVRNILQLALGILQPSSKNSPAFFFLHFFQFAGCLSFSSGIFQPFLRHIPAFCLRLVPAC